MELREATIDDARLLFEWASDTEVRRMAFTQGPIRWEDHRAWLSRKLLDPGTRIYVAQDASGLPIGQIRFDINGSDAEIDVHLAKVFRNQGLGAQIIALGVSRLFEDPRIQTAKATIKSENAGSLKAFGKAGFDRVGVSTISGFQCHLLARRRS